MIWNAVAETIVPVCESGSCASTLAEPRLIEASRPSACRPGLVTVDREAHMSLRDARNLTRSRATTTNSRSLPAGDRVRHPEEQDQQVKIVLRHYHGIVHGLLCCRTPPCRSRHCGGRPCGVVALRSHTIQLGDRSGQAFNVWTCCSITFPPAPILQKGRT